MIVALEAQAWSLRTNHLGGDARRRSCSNNAELPGLAQEHLSAPAPPPGPHSSRNFRIVRMMLSHALQLTLNAPETAGHDPVVAFS